MVSLISGLKIEGIVKRRGLKSQGPLYIHECGTFHCSPTNILDMICQSGQSLLIDHCLAGKAIIRLITMTQIQNGQGVQILRFSALILNLE